MKKRSVMILNKYIRNMEQRYTIQSLAKEFNVSNKTIQNDIKEINAFLNMHSLGTLDSKASGKIILNTKVSYKAIKQALENLDFYSYRLSSEERVIYIMITLLMEKDYVTMQSLADELGVTRVTIVNDFEVAKESLKKYDETLLCFSNKGVFFKKTNYEKTVRFLVELLSKVDYINESPAFFKRIIDSVLKTQYTYKIVFSTLDRIAQKRNMFFLGNALSKISLYVYVAIHYPFYLSEEKVVDSSNQITKLDFLLKDLSEILDMQLPTIVLFYYQTFLYENHIFDLMKSKNYIELYEIVRYFLVEVGKEICYDLQNDDLLIESLVLHIKSIREMTDIVFASHDIHIPIDINLVRQATYMNIQILENFLNYQFDKNIINSIVLHLCASMVRRFGNEKKLRVMIVCASSMATGKYLEAQVNNYFDFDIVSVSAIQNIEKELLKEQHIDFIISSIPLQIDEYPVVLVNSKLTMEDLNNIQSTVFELGKTTETTYSHYGQLCERMHYLFQTIENTDIIVSFSKEVENIIDSYERKYIRSGKVALHMMLKPKYISKIEESLTWEKAIKKAAKPLHDNHYIQSLYIEKAIRNVQEFGDYIIVSPSVALAHAGSEDGVYKDGLSLLVSKEGIVFESGEKVHLLFFFTSKGTQDYTELLKEIISLGKEQEMIQDIIQANNTIEIFYKLIK